MISAIISRLVILLFGTLYPAYASYKAVRTKNVKEYVKWMMYWIVFALFTCAETFTDLFLSFWFPFYYEIKIILVIWLLSPATKGSSILYRNFVHPALTKREQVGLSISSHVRNPFINLYTKEIDEYISKAKEQGYHTMLHLGSKGVTYATNVIMQTAIKNLPIADHRGDPFLKPLTNDQPGEPRAEDQVDGVRHVDRMEVIAESSDDSRPSTPTPAPAPADEPDLSTSPAHNTRSRKTRSRNVVRAK